MANSFGFSTAPASSGDIMPIAKIDARGGRIFLVDRENNGAGFENIVTDITSKFRAVFDAEHVEVGYIAFSPGGAPVTALVLLPIDAEPVLPPPPTPDAKPGVRFVIRLSQQCAGDSPAVREIMTNAKTTLRGLEAVFDDFKAQRAAHPGELPIIALDSMSPVKTGSGAQSSTNYLPKFIIVGWTKRPPDLIYKPRSLSSPAQAMKTDVAPPQRPSSLQPDINDFG